MYKTIKARNVADGSTFRFEYPIPGKCPCCHSAIDANALDAHFVINDDSSAFSPHTKVTITFFCYSCESFFLGIYSLAGEPVSYNCAHKVSRSKLIPYSEEKRIFSDDILSLSPDFVSIYNQSEIAEQRSLSDICGMGYRKALEFLVKDFAIFSHPDKKESIKSSMLSNCINAYIDNDRIKTLAKASAWLGNDETHYIKKHSSYTVKDLKLFINSVVSYIDSELNFLKAQKLLNNRQ